MGLINAGIEAGRMSKSVRFPDRERLRSQKKSPGETAPAN